VRGVARLLLTEARRGQGVIYFVLAAGVGAVIAYSEHSANVHLWHETGRGLAYSLILLGPVAAAAGAWAGGLDEQVGLRELLDSTPRVSWHRHLMSVAAVAVGSSHPW
jgi:hypothetical protein